MDYISALKIQPNNINCLYHLGLLYEHQGKLE